MLPKQEQGKTESNILLKCLRGIKALRGIISFEPQFQRQLWLAGEGCASSALASHCCRKSRAGKKENGQCYLKAERTNSWNTWKNLPEDSQNYLMDF
jgi:hypothetical protein